MKYLPVAGLMTRRKRYGATSTSGANDGSILISDDQAGVIHRVTDNG